MNQRNIIKKNITSISIILFVTIFYIIQFFKPSIIYNDDGSLRQFGIVQKRKQFYLYGLYH